MDLQQLRRFFRCWGGFPGFVVIGSEIWAMGKKQLKTLGKTETTGTWVQLKSPQKRQVGRQPGGIQWNDLWLNMVGAKMREFHHKIGSESVILGRVHICTFYDPNVFWNGVTLQKDEMHLLKGFCFGPGSFGASYPLDWVEKYLPKLLMWQDMQGLCYRGLDSRLWMYNVFSAFHCSTILPLVPYCTWEVMISSMHQIVSYHALRYHCKFASFVFMK